MPTQTIGDTGQPRTFETILLGGLIAGALDGLDAVVYYRSAMRVPPGRLFQHIASGVLGAQSFRGGWQTVLLGLGLHFTIALGAAATFYAACFVFPALYRMPAIYGPAFGLCVYVVMHYVVVPMSRVTPRTVPVSAAEFLDQIFSHTVFVGLPIALMARRGI